MSLNKRLERLEVLAREPGKAEPPKKSRAMERLLHAHENARREIERREPLPELPYTEEDREDDRRCLEELIPKYRASPGYQSGEGKAFLDRMEQETSVRLERVMHFPKTCTSRGFPRANHDSVPRESCVSDRSCP
jgi:hypothetical protein